VCIIAASQARVIPFSDITRTGARGHRLIRMQHDRIRIQSGGGIA
jgi:hypothetical protein